MSTLCVVSVDFDSDEESEMSEVLQYKHLCTYFTCLLEHCRQLVSHTYINMLLRIP